MNRKFLLLLGSTLLVGTLFAQKQANMWCFGDNAGLDFNSGTAVFFEATDFYSHEGSATIADDDGNLLFSTNGYTIWDRNFVPMPNGDGGRKVPNGNGLASGNSTAQPAIIIPRPGSQSIYYVFTLGHNAGRFMGDGKLSYSEVDMTLNNGNGDVTANRNIELITYSSESITAIDHANGVDKWVIAHPFNSNDFYAYLVTSAGVSTSPVITTIGEYIGGEGIRAPIGMLKGSPNGCQIAMANMGGAWTYLFDFNTLTGELSNELSLSPSFNLLTDIEFSASSNMLYVSEQQSGSTTEDSKLFQFDLTAEDIPSSMTEILTYEGNGMKMALGPDRKIYATMRFGSSFLSVINNPDLKGLDCGFSADVINLGSANARGGFPNFLRNYLRDETAGPCDTTIVELPEVEEVIIPNSFTPNDDGTNDVFTPVIYDENMEQYELQVYNSWGELLFETDDMNQGWDGKSNGVVLPQGVYNYRIVYNDQVFYGKVTIIS